MGFLAFTTFDLVNNLVGILYIIFNVFQYTVVVFLVNGKIKWMNEWMKLVHCLAEVTALCTNTYLTEISKQYCIRYNI